MNFSATTYQANNTIINKVHIKSGWVLVYNEFEKQITTRPIFIQDSILETANNFYIKESEEEVYNIITELGLSEKKATDTIIDKAIKEIANYTSPNKKGLV
jgi:hypothetical protein